MFDFDTNMACLQDESTPILGRRSGDPIHLPPEARLAQGGGAGTVIQVNFLDSEGVEHTAQTRTTVAPGSYSRARSAYEVFYASLGLELLSVQFLVERSHLMAGVRPKPSLSLIPGGLQQVDIRL